MAVSLDALRFVETASVCRAARLAASLRRQADAIEFAYVPEYLADPGPPVATTLPVVSKPIRTHSAGALPPFFSGLLPEGRRLHALRRAVKASADDELTLLLAVGGDTVGNVRVVPAGEPPAATESRVQVASFREVRFEDLFAQATGLSEIDRVGLPGVQEKTSARMINVPVVRASGRYILKLEPPEFPHLVRNEAFFLDAARRSGIAVAEAEIVLDCDGRPGLLVRRFDRTEDGEGGQVSLAQEDACQVLGRYPADKYRLTTEEVVAGLASVAGAPLVAAREWVRQFAFAYLTLNGDAHAKNVAVLRDPDGEWRAAPAYDVPSTYPYGDHDMALSIGGRTREDIDRSSFLALGASVGLTPRAVRKALDGLLERVPTWLDRIDELPFDQRTIHKMRRAVSYRAGRLTG